MSIPTYGVGAPDRNPMFLERRVYQGSSGVVYPHPVIDRVLDTRADRQYTAAFLENEYLRIMILPELGGRVQMALDKTNGYHFIYHNRVIKPALVGLAGPWISGGIEFNWPQHHRPSTFEPLDWRIVEGEDGSRTVWCAEIERMFFTKGMHGFTLRPGQAALEVSVHLYNRTAEPQSFLWWANPAVSVNDDYQSVFPPDVHAVMDHGKRDVSAFPIATGTYYKVDYSPGTDISRYKNIPVPTSYMAYHSDFDFVGDYDHGAQAGMLHVADHHLVPGKKQWTWGNSDFGRAWDRQLTDEDGPYIELMCGAFTDNQPDFSWIMPGEEKRFTQVFMPYKRIGPPTNANQHAAIRLEIEGERASVGVYVTRALTARVTLEMDGVALHTWERALSPTAVLVEEVAIPAAPKQSYELRVTEGGRDLISFRPLPDMLAPIPEPASAARQPSDLASNEELYLNGLHLEQYRHATYPPEPYYEEALRRDPSDSRCNNALGLLQYRRGRFVQAEPYFRRAIDSLTRRNPNPYDGESYYYLGLTLRMQGRHDEAYDAFYKAVWSAAWQDSAYFELARIASRRGQLTDALVLIDHALRRNASHHKVRHLKTAMLRHLGRRDDARREALNAIAADAIEYGAWWERNLLDGDPTFVELARGNPHTHEELALDYMHAGMFGDALALLELAPDAGPMAAYYAAQCHRSQGDSAAAQRALARAGAASPDYCFPNRLESVAALEEAIRNAPADARAPYYLGNFWYAHRVYDEAIARWELAARLDPAFPTVQRNLGLAYLNKRADAQRAHDAYERAFALNPDDARVFFELDQLARKLNVPPEIRLTRLASHQPLVDRRDDLTIEYVTLLNVLGRHADAEARLTRRNFHPWEGGEGRVTGQYVVALVEQARDHLDAGHWRKARVLLERARAYPDSLGEGKLPGAQENNVLYFLGLAHAGMGDEAGARQCFTAASIGLSEPSSAVFYNDQPPDMIFYQGLALRKLGRSADADNVFSRLVDYGRAHLADDVSLDYFAVSLPSFLVFDEDLSLRNRIHCHYMMALGLLGLGQHAPADAEFARVLELDANHAGAVLHRAWLPDLD